MNELMMMTATKTTSLMMMMMIQLEPSITKLWNLTRDRAGS